jgi:hypothetical protein
MAIDAHANKAIIILRNMTHPSMISRSNARRFRRRILTDPGPTLGRVLGSGWVILLTSARLCLEDQQPRQMLLILRSTVLFSSVIAASTLPDPADLPEPVVTPLSVLTPRPDDWAVPAVLVPGAGGDASLDGFCAPLGSSPELFNPPGLAGPDGTPVTLCVPAPAEPAFGEPAAVLLLAEGPLAAPPALAPPVLAPPPVPPLLPPPLWASDMAGDIRIVIAATAAAAHASFIGNLLFESNGGALPLFLPERFPRQIIQSQPLDARSDRACAN